MNATIMWPSGFHAETGTVRWTAAATTKRTRPLRTLVRSIMSASTQNGREAARPVKRRPAGGRSYEARSRAVHTVLTPADRHAGWTQACWEELTNQPSIRGTERGPRRSLCGDAQVREVAVPVVSDPQSDQAAL